MHKWTNPKRIYMQSFLRFLPPRAHVLYGQILTLFFKQPIKKRVTVTEEPFKDCVVISEIDLFVMIMLSSHDMNYCFALCNMKNKTCYTLRYLTERRYAKYRIE